LNDFLERISNLSPKRLALLAHELHAQVEQLKRTQRQPVAIIGMGCRFPGEVDGPADLWKLLRAGADAIVPAPSDRWNLEQPIESLRDAHGLPLKMQGGFLKRVDLFDPLFFGISPREAQSMDPQQRLVLEVAWEALENAGLSADDIQGTQTGVFLGIAGNDFSQRLLDQDLQDLDGYVATGSSHAVAAGRLAYTLHLTGPCLSIDTACSSSLVAISTACDSVRSGRSRLAIAGGVSLILSSETTVVLAKGGMLAPDFRCKAFDAAADGFVRGEGCGLIVLKRLEDAQRDGDRILAVIRGTAVNQDGRSSGLTAPNGPSQQALLRDALEDAGLTAAQVQFIEAHGTGTSLGDPIEAQSLAAVFGEERPADQPLMIGSIKTNFGHLEAAAGIAGLMKLVLAIEHGIIPPLLHLKTPNPHVDWPAMPLALPTQVTLWPGERAERIGGVSSFGFSGTNAHLLLGAAPELHLASAAASSPVERSQHLLGLSAKTHEALQELSRRYIDFLGEHREAHVADVCFTANRGRAHHEHRLAIVGESSQQIRERLQLFTGAAMHSTSRTGKLERSQSPDVVFLFTGQGSQYSGMSGELYRTQPTFRATLDRCDHILREIWGRSLIDLLLSEQADQAELLNQTAFTQPALFALEYALAELLRSWGIRPMAVMGHSVGEYAAACVAGVFTLEEGLKLVAARGQLMQALPDGGGMLAVLASENDVVRALAPFSRRLSIAAFNGPSNVVVSGPISDLEQFVRRLEAQNLPSQRLSVSHAFHSALLDPALDAVERAAQAIAYAPAQLTVISNLTGKAATANELRSAAYWRQQARQPVQFAAGMRTLRAMGHKTFIEIGPAAVLCGLARRFITDSDCRWLPTLRRGRSDWEQLLETVAELYVSGTRIDWTVFDRDYPRRKVALPTYPFQRSRYWPEIHHRQGHRPSAASPKHTEQIYRDWLYEPAWQPLIDRTAPPSYLPSPPQLQQLASAEAIALYRELPAADDDGAYREIDLLCRDYILEALESLGCVLRTGERFSTDALRSRLRILDRYARLFERLLEILAEDGVLTREATPHEASKWLVAQTPARNAADRQLQSVTARHPQCAAELAVLAPCGQHLAQVLRGACDPMQLLFPGGSLELTAKLYYETRPVALFNALIERCLREAVAQLPRDRALRILEIGAGTGGTTARVLPHLPADRTSYLFTDVSPQFLGQARERFRDYSFVQYQHFALGESAQSSQGLRPGSFDIIIAANVIHATPDLRRSLDAIKQLLKPEGLLVLLEVVRPQRMGDLSVGLMEGWWSFTDTQTRPRYPLIAETLWIELLHETGFALPCAVPGPATNKTGLFANQSVLLARKPSAQAPSSYVTATRLTDRWLLWIDEGGLGLQLAARLRERGDECLVVRRGARFESLGDREFQVDPHNAADHARVIDAFQGSNASRCRGAVYLWGLDASVDEGSDLESVRTAVQLACRGALAAIQSIVRAKGMSRKALAFITRGGECAPAQAALSGLVATAAIEHPELHCRRIDLDSDTDIGDSTTLLNELLRDEQDASQIALRGSQRLALRLIRSAARELNYPSYRLKPNATYLVTGGLTGLGLETAAWLVEQGARQLVLVGRRAASLLCQARIAAWDNAGVNVACVQADIGEEADADRVFSTISDLSLPLCGVVHGAGPLDDAALLQQDWASFERVLKAKVAGAWNLHRRTRNTALDFFVLYSSGASLFGSEGQANHSTANAFLDGLVWYRKSRGLPALSINWGAWREIGAAAHHAVIGRIEKSGVQSIDISNGLSALECVLATGRDRVAVLPIDWTKFSGAASSDRSGLLTELQAEHQQYDVSADEKRFLVTESEWRDMLAAAEPHRRNALLGELVNFEGGRILGLSSSQTIDPNQPLRELGMDSLMSVQFRNRLSALLELELPPTLLYNYPTVHALVAYLISCLTPQILGAEQFTKHSWNQHDLDLDSLTEDELAKMLEQQVKLVE
jgi:acyl transferase domain-containing protein/acyl carrier protein